MLNNNKETKNLKNLHISSSGTSAVTQFRWLEFMMNQIFLLKFLEEVSFNSGGTLWKQNGDHH